VNGWQLLDHPPGQTRSATPAGRALAELARLRAEYVRRRVVFIDGALITELAQAFGAVQADFARLRSSSESLPPDPTLPFRRSRNGRFCFDVERGEVRRLEHQPFVLSATEDFVRHDSGQLRRFAELDVDLQRNTVVHALFLIKYLLIAGLRSQPRPQLDYATPNWVCTLFHLRTVTTADLLGEPALEGVHSDGVDHTMTTLLGTSNVSDDSAVTYLHDMRESNGTRWDLSQDSLRHGRYQHRQFLDTLLIVDHEHKHSVSPVRTVDRTRPGSRDMLIFFTRKPTLPGHVSAPYDSLRSSSQPLTVNLVPPLPTVDEAVR
jgi:hypothetical protein